MARKGSVVPLVIFVLASLFVLGACGSSSDSPSSPSAPADVSGRWSVTAVGYVPMTMTLAQDGESVTGTCTGYAGRVTGTVSGSSVTLNVVFNDGLTSTFSGTVDGDMMRGTYSNSQGFSDAWSATRG